ncbi:hypothetical protein Nepgr_003534 [Nepenthes gracilis]|uniref:Pentatricopeptide repeat-containing protein n=1 Tax=Nepenthes gracilis TaxID=150966 RepID=A0AAD3XDY6_NEPGR|nr:hypothetical protein Nepgr_003534 [Nepenthes gracilis]
MAFQNINDAVKVFDEMPQRNVASLNAMISGFSQNGHYEEALLVFREVGIRKFRPNSVTIAGALSACDAVEHGGQVHCWAIKLGVERDVYVGTGIVTMYMTCAELISAIKVFGTMGYRNVVSYNAFLSGLLQNEVNGVVLNVFKNMLQSSKERPNSVTLISVLGACSNISDLQFGRQIHGFVAKSGLNFDTLVGTALVDMYCKCGHCRWAYDIFRELNGKRNLITWNSMIAGMMSNGESDTAVELFSDIEAAGLVPDSATWNTIISGSSQLGKGMDALKFFKNMQSDGICPSLKALTSLLPACSMLSSLQHGKEIHGHAIKADIIYDEFLATSLIDMYMKCGQFSWARRVFDQFDIKPVDPAFWNAMISGYGRNGDDKSAFEIFDMMREANVQPNSATFMNVLSVCSHTGKLEKGWQVLRMMTSDYGLTSTPEHFACVIDLLGRSGELDKARDLALQIREPSASVFSSLLGASGWHSNPSVGVDMAEKLVEFEPENSAPFVILSNLYAAMGRWKDVQKIRDVMDLRKVKKLHGYSLNVT